MYNDSYVIQRLVLKGAFNYDCKIINNEVINRYISQRVANITNGCYVQ